MFDSEYLKGQKNHVWYRKSHCGDKTILRPSYLYNGIFYTSLYWIGALVVFWLDVFVVSLPLVPFTLKQVLENDTTRAAITWFENIYMDANPEKFQSIILNKGGRVSISLSVHDNVVVPSDDISLLGITLDDSLNLILIYLICIKMHLGKLMH